MHVIISNYGNDAIALIQWAHQQQLKAVHVLYVDTGWSAPHWPLRVSTAEAWVKQLGFSPVTLKPAADFAELMHNRGSFPTRKFQWCAGFLKGLPINDWLEDHDPMANCTIMLAKRRSASRLQFNLAEWLEDSEHYNQRTIWHPLYAHSTAERDQLIAATPFPLLTHRSLECDPCVNSDLNDVRRMDPQVILRAADLERALKSQLLDPSLYQQQPDLKAARALIGNAGPEHTAPQELFDMGCGSYFGCGL